MWRIWRIGLGLVAVTAVAAGCGDEAPTEVGGDLLGENLRTVRLLLDAPEFLQGDTTYDQIGTLNQVSYGIVAHEFEGELDAHTVFRVERPFEAVYEDADGTTQRDSLDAIRGGTLTVVLDSLADVVGPIELAVLSLTEDWDRGTVSWALRYDTAGVSEAWTVPGGTTGDTMATATWTEGDTLRIAIDSAAAAVWHDTIGAFRGGSLQTTTPGARLRVRSVGFEFDVVPTDADTVVTAGRVTQAVAVASPDTDPGADVLRIGGLPIWRSMVRFQPLAELPVPCEQDSTTCTIPLSDVTVNTANLILRTQPTGGRRAERSLRVEGRGVLEGPGVPLTRSPLSRPLGLMDESLGVAAFVAPAAVEARIPVTGYVQRNVSPPEGEDPLLWLALTATAEGATFGYGQFGSFASGVPPQLELVVTIPVDKVTP